MRITERKLRRIIRQVISENVGGKSKIQKITLKWWKLNIQDLENKLNSHDLDAYKKTITSENNSQLLDDLDLDLGSGKIQEHNRVFIHLVYEIYRNRGYRSWITSAEPILGNNIAISISQSDFDKIKYHTNSIFLRPRKRIEKNTNPLKGMSAAEMKFYFDRLDVEGLTVTENLNRR
jgi:hypothetical protein